MPHDFILSRVETGAMYACAKLSSHWLHFAQIYVCPALGQTFLELPLAYNPTDFAQVLWSETGEQVCIATDESFYILLYKPDAVEAARGDPELVTEDGIEDAFDVRWT